MAQGLAAAINAANHKHPNIYAGANRWTDPYPNWFTTKDVAADLEAASITFDSSQTQGYPEDDDEECVDEEDLPGGDE